MRGRAASGRVLRVLTRLTVPRCGVVGDSSAHINAGPTPWTQVGRRRSKSGVNDGERTPWHATQRAAWEALKKTEEEEQVMRIGFPSWRVRRPMLWLSLLSPIILLHMFTASAAVAAGLAFFETAETRGQGEWDMATLSSGAKVYIARRPAQVIALDEIEAAEVSQNPTYADAQSAYDHEIRDVFGKGLAKEPSTRPIGYYYVLTFTLRNRVVRQFGGFVSQNVRRKFDLRLDGRHVSYVSWLDPDASNVIKLTLPDYDESALRLLLSPLTSRVIWKTWSE